MFFTCIEGLSGRAQGKNNFKIYNDKEDTTEKTWNDQCDHFTHQQSSKYAWSQKHDLSIYLLDTL